jgi:hypothetical protein
VSAGPLTDTASPIDPSVPDVCSIPNASPTKLLAGSD